MRLICALAIVLTLSACDKAEKVGTAKSGDMAFTEICIDGVVYLIRKGGYSGYMSVKLKPDSTVVTCKG